MEIYDAAIAIYSVAKHIHNYTTASRTMWKKAFGSDDVSKIIYTLIMKDCNTKCS